MNDKIRAGASSARPTATLPQSSYHPEDHGRGQDALRDAVNQEADRHPVLKSINNRIEVAGVEYRVQHVEAGSHLADQPIEFAFQTGVPSLVQISQFGFDGEGLAVAHTEILCSAELTIKALVRARALPADAAQIPL